MFGTILGNVDRITLGLDIGTELGSLDISFDDYKDGKLEGFIIVDSLVYTDGKVLVSYEVIKLELSGVNVRGAILGNVDGITLDIDFVTELVYLDGCFGGSNDGKLEGLLLG